MNRFLTQRSSKETLLKLSKTHRLLAASALVACAMTAAPAWGQVATEYAAITNLSGGWNLDTLAVFHAGQFVNPSGCPVTTFGYATYPADPGHNLFHTLALAAFLNRKEVSLTVSGCIFSKPKIIAVTLR